MSNIMLSAGRRLSVGGRGEVFYGSIMSGLHLICIILPLLHTGEEWNIISQKRDIFAGGGLSGNGIDHDARAMLNIRDM